MVLYLISIFIRIEAKRIEALIHKSDANLFKYSIKREREVPAQLLASYIKFLIILLRHPYKILKHAGTSRVCALRPCGGLSSAISWPQTHHDGDSDVGAKSNGSGESGSTAENSRGAPSNALGHS